MPVLESSVRSTRWHAGIARAGAGKTGHHEIQRQVVGHHETLRQTVIVAGHLILIAYFAVRDANRNWRMQFLNRPGLGRAFVVAVGIAKHADKIHSIRTRCRRTHRRAGCSPAATGSRSVTLDFHVRGRTRSTETNRSSKPSQHFASPPSNRAHQITRRASPATIGAVAPAQIMPSGFFHLNVLGWQTRVFIDEFVQRPYSPCARADKTEHRADRMPATAPPACASRAHAGRNAVSRPDVPAMQPAFFMFAPKPHLSFSVARL